MAVLTSWIFFLPPVFFAVSLKRDFMPAQPVCYQAGESIAEDIYVYDGAGRKRRLLELASGETKVIYLLVFGGPTLNPERSHGGLWCEDTFNDMPLSNYLYLKYRERGVAFVPVACPPVYHEELFGYSSNSSLLLREGAPAWHKALQVFVQAARGLQNNHVIPFDELYFDPQFHLLFNYEKRVDLTTLPGAAPAWAGKFKPCGDRQCYSTPTIWLLSKTGKILHEPFAGNRYAHAEQRLRYTVREVENALRQALGIFPVSAAIPD